MLSQHITCMLNILKCCLNHSKNGIPSKFCHTKNLYRAPCGDNEYDKERQSIGDECDLKQITKNET